MLRRRRARRRRPTLRRQPRTRRRPALPTGRPRRSRRGTRRNRPAAGRIDGDPPAPVTEPRPRVPDADEVLLRHAVLRLARGGELSQPVWISTAAPGRLRSGPSSVSSAEGRGDGRRSDRGIGGLRIEDRCARVEYRLPHAPTPTSACWRSAARLRQAASSDRRRRSREAWCWAIRTWSARSSRARASRTRSSDSTVLAVSNRRAYPPSKSRSAASAALRRGHALPRSANAACAAHAASRAAAASSNSNPTFHPITEPARCRT